MKNEKDMTALTTTSNFQFSAVKLEKLGAAEYTLVTIVVDVSYSVSSFKDELEKMLSTIIDSCANSPRKENLMIRIVSFNQDIIEIQGFKLLDMINSNDYSILECDGMTALYDATLDSIEATETYSQILADQEFNANSIVFVITDGEDNRSSHSPSEIKTKTEALLRSESVESLTSILIGVNLQDYNVKTALEEFKNQAELSSFIDIGEADAPTLAKLAKFISKSISSTSQSLQTGNASVLLDW